MYVLFPDLCVCFQNPLAQIEDERREHHTKLIKMEKEMEEVFERKVSHYFYLRKSRKV